MLRIESKDNTTTATLTIKGGWFYRAFLTWVIAAAVFGIIFGVIYGFIPYNEIPLFGVTGFFGGVILGILVTLGITVLAILVIGIGALIGIIWNDS